MNMYKLSTKDYLSQAYKIDQRINSKIEQAQSLRELAGKATTVLSGTSTDGTQNICRMENIIIKILALESEINDDLNRLVDLKYEIFTAIKRVESPEFQTLLELRYLCFKTWEEIAVNLRLDIRWVHRLHNKALCAVDVIRHS